MHAQLYGLVGQTTPSSPRAAQVTWQLGGPWLSIQILLTPTNKPKAISQKVSSYLEKMAEFCFKLLRLCAVIHTQGLPKAPNSLPVCQGTSKHRWDSWSMEPQMAEHFARQPGSAQPSLVLDTRNQKFFCYSVNGSSTPKRNRLPSTFKEAY